MHDIKVNRHGRKRCRNDDRKHPHAQEVEQGVVLGVVDAQGLESAPEAVDHMIRNGNKLMMKARATFMGLYATR